MPRHRRPVVVGTLGVTVDTVVVVVVVVGARLSVNVGQKGYAQRAVHKIWQNPMAMAYAIGFFQCAIGYFRTFARRGEML